jgi:hypothetical protein
LGIKNIENFNNKKKTNMTKRVKAALEISEFEETKSLKEIEVILDKLLVTFCTTSFALFSTGFII